jgi:hypothetical protein
MIYCIHELIQQQHPSQLLTTFTPIWQKLSYPYLISELNKPKPLDFPPAELSIFMSQDSAKKIGTTDT